MSTDNNSGEQNLGASGAPGAGEDLSSALAEAESGFVTTEEKKSQTTQWIALSALAVIGLGIIYFMYMRKGPASAEAADATAPQQQADNAHQTINTFLSNGPAGIRLMQQLLKNTEKVVQQFLEYPSVAQVPLEEVKTNPFRANKGAGDDSESGARRRREEERASALKAVQNLNLQSIMSGTRKACMINNTLYTEGQQVDRFIVEKIQSGTVVVKTGSYRFELKMQK